MLYVLKWISKNSTEINLAEIKSSGMIGQNINFNPLAPVHRVEEKVSYSLEG